MSLSGRLTGLALVEQVKVHQTVDAAVRLLRGQSQLGPQCCQVDLRLSTVQTQLLAETLPDIRVHPPHHHCQVLTLQGLGQSG